jgi:uncharacterized protein
MSSAAGALWEALKEHNEAKAVYAATRLDNASVRDENGIPALSHASAMGYVELLRLLLSRGAAADDRTSDSDQGPLFVACMMGRAEAARLLLAAGVPPGATYCGEEAVPGIVAAATRNHLQVIDMLLNAGGSIDDADAQGHTALHTACFCGSQQCAVFLVERGANANLRSKKGATPLAWAAHKGHVSVVKALLDHGADVNGENASGPVVAPSEIEIVPLLGAARNNRLDALRLLLDRGADMEKKNQRGETALHAAAARDALECVKELLVRGADFGAVDSQARTVVEKAGDAGKCETLEYLVQWEQNGGKPPLEEDSKVELESDGKGEAKWQPDFSKIDPLYHHLASWMGESQALVRAAGAGETSVCRALLEGGADPNSCQKMTPLAAAAEQAHLEVVRLLLMSGADPQGLSQKKLPLEWARQGEPVNEMRERVVALLEHPLICGGCGQVMTPETAKRCSQCKVVKFCSPDCQRRSWKRFHRRQCTIWKERKEMLRNRK